MTLDPEGYWFCTDRPTREAIGFRIRGDRAVQVLRCPHGVWNDLESARAAHATNELPGQLPFQELQ